MTALLRRLVRLFRDSPYARPPRGSGPARFDPARLDPARFDATRAAFERESG